MNLNYIKDVIVTYIDKKFSVSSHYAVVKFVENENGKGYSTYVLAVCDNAILDIINSFGNLLKFRLFSEDDENSFCVIEVTNKERPHYLFNDHNGILLVKVSEHVDLYFTDYFANYFDTEEENGLINYIKDCIREFLCIKMNNSFPMKG